MKTGLNRVPTQTANAAVKSKGSVCEIANRKIVGRLGHKKAIWAIAHRLCRLIWEILHQGVSYIEYGARLNAKALRRRAQRLLRDLHALGYRERVFDRAAGVHARLFRCAKSGSWRTAQTRRSAPHGLLWNQRVGGSHKIRIAFRRWRHSRFSRAVSSSPHPDHR